MSEIYPFDFEGLEPEHAESIYNAFAKLKSKFPAKFTGDFRYDFGRFASFSHYKSIDFRFITELDNGFNKWHIVFPEVSYSYAGGKGGMNNASEYHAFGLAGLKRDFGHVVIRPETFTDKIREMIKPVELDFEDDPDFSSRFYVLASDRDKAVLAMDASFRHAVMSIAAKNFLIEIVADQLIICNQQLIDPDTTLSFAMFLKEILSK
ncbi:hypothetical protein ACTHGU_10045 [Chitinophagaceae bacterium MMS25-I14]